MIPLGGRHLREWRMMGRREEGQGKFFYSFDLDKVVPPDHLVRQLDGLLDLSWVHKELAPYYSHTGRPSIDPVDGHLCSRHGFLLVKSILEAFCCSFIAQTWPSCRKAADQEDRAQNNLDGTHARGEGNC
jgi:hypothetical protein